LRLERSGYSKIVVKGDSETDGTNQPSSNNLIMKQEVVIVAVGNSDGNRANQMYPAKPILNNSQMKTNIIERAFHFGTSK